MPCSDYSPTFSVLPKLKVYKLLSRVRFNTAPVASERVELTGLISQGEKDLIGYKETIAQLQEKIVALKNEQKGLNRQLRLAKSLIAPIRKLPPEVLHAIFIAHGVENIIRSPKSATCYIPGFTIASVCSHWRSIATTTPALWKDISVEIENYTHHNSRSPLTERLLELSQKSLLSISISINDATEAVLSTVPTFTLLCSHAERWERLDVWSSLTDKSLPGFQALIDALTSIHGRLSSLHTLDVADAASPQCNAWVEGAPKLQTLSAFDIDSTSTVIPWNQIINFIVKQSRVFHIAKSLLQMPNLASLKVNYFDHPIADDVTEIVSHFNLRSLNVCIDGDTDERQMQTLFKSFTIPRLQTVHIEVKNGHLTSQNDLTWSSMELPSLISRSSALITSLTLERVWMPTSNLISLLRSTPALSSLSLSEPACKEPAIDPIINNQFLSSMHLQHRDQPILTHLTSLDLEVRHQASFSTPTFVEMIHSRWKPVCLDDELEVTSIKNVGLYARDFAIDLNAVHPLIILRKRGLNIRIEDDEWEFTSEDEDEEK